MWEQEKAESHRHSCGNTTTKTIDVAVVTRQQPPELLTDKYWEGNTICHVGTTENGKP